MCAAAPHRGDDVDTMLHGHVALAVANRADLVDAHLGLNGNHAVAFCGVLDDTRELARRLGVTGEPNPAEIVALQDSQSGATPSYAACAACSPLW